MANRYEIMKTVSRHLIIHCIVYVAFYKLYQSRPRFDFSCIQEPQFATR